MPGQGGGIANGGSTCVRRKVGPSQAGMESEVGSPWACQAWIAPTADPTNHALGKSRPRPDSVNPPRCSGAAACCNSEKCRHP